MSIKERFNRLASLCKSASPPNRRRPPVPLVVEYHDRWLLPPLAVLVGTLMAVYGHHIPFGIFIRKMDFYKAAAPSILAAWAVMRLILRNTRQLDESCPWWPVWWPAPLRRLLLQAYHGLAKPGFFVFGIFSLYFLVRQRPELIPRYLSEDFPLVLLLLTGFNLLCWAYHQLRKAELQRQWKDWAYRIRKAAPVEPEVPSGVEVIPYGERVKDRVALYEPDARHEATRSTGFDGREDMDVRPVKEVYSDVTGPYFYQIRRELIVNRKAVRQVRREGEKVDVLLGEPRPGKVVRVSKRRRKGFLAWWHGGGD